MTETGRRLRGGAAHRAYTVTVFIILAALDNVALALAPPLVSPISTDLGVTETAVATTVALSLLITALSAVVWAYLGDRSDRKRLLMLGTAVWATGMAATAYAPGTLAFVAALSLAAVGLGAVASVGFSVVSDLIAPHRRGLVMGLWGLSQGLGTLVGIGLAGGLGGADWRAPFRVLALAGFAATVAYLFTYRVPRGHSEPRLRELYAAGGEYDHRISLADLPGIAARRTNVWLVAQGLTAQLAFGALVWLPRLFQAKAEQIGYAEAQAITIGSIFTILFFSGGVLALVGAAVGDRLQRRTPRGRAIVAAVGVLAAVPVFLVLFFLPLRLDVPTDETRWRAILRGVLTSILTEPAMAATFLLALLAMTLISAQSPNWYALIAEVNPPEHRGTAFSVGNLVNGLGRSAGTDLMVRLSTALQSSLPPPTNFAVSLAVLQLAFIPTGVMYWLASRTAPADIATVDRLLSERAGERPATQVTDSTPS